MSAHAHDEKLLIHFFQDSLARMALSWYMHLEPTRIHSWKGLVGAFLKQYKYNIDMAPNRMQLDVNPIRNKPQNPQQRVVECPNIPKYSDLG